MFDDDRYFDIEIEYAKAAPDDILLRITAHNRGPEAAELHLLPQLWFRNTWSWREGASPGRRCAPPTEASRSAIRRWANTAGELDGAPELLFTDNETNATRLFGTPTRGGAATTRTAFTSE